jgi:hypothetical protein
MRRLMSVVKVAAVKVVDAKSASAGSVSGPFPLVDRVAAVSADDPEAGPAPETAAENATTPANAAAAARVRARRRRWCIAIVLSSTACRSLRYCRAIRSRGVRGQRTGARKSDNLPKVPIRRARHVATFITCSPKRCGSRLSRLLRWVVGGVLMLHGLGHGGALGALA